MDISLEYLQKAIRKSYPEIIIESCSQYSDAYVNEVYKIETNKGNYVLKKYDDRSSWKARKEALVYELIQAKTSVPVPEIHIPDTRKTILPFAYLLMSEISGKTLKEYYKESQNEYEKIGEKVGKCLAELHSITFNHFGFIDDRGILPEENWQNYFIDNLFQYSWWEAFSKTNIPEEILYNAASYIKKRQDLLKNINQPTFVHADFTQNNIKFEDEEISGIIDVEWAFSGDPIYDFTKIELFMPNDIKKPIIKGYQSKRDLNSDFNELSTIYLIEKALRLYYFNSKRKDEKEKARILNIIKKHLNL
ncbi:MAG: aminoglycoside phosphotransferase family protein [Candidatus Aenigmarchaeota archaeon]|nr:aminoglycoside phosphotransferase family protein [Candidatus Aenigmarchaeota archaeon]